MKIWFRRIFALAFISMGIALAFLPYNNTRSGSVESEVVYLQKENLLNADSIKSQYPGFEIKDVSGSEFTEENYPNIWWKFNNLDQGWVNDTCNISEWNSFQNAFFKEKEEFRLIVFRDALIACSTKIIKETHKVHFSYLGRYNTQIKELSENDLKKYKTIIRAIENVNFGKESVSELSPIPITEWYKMVDYYLNPMEDSQTFKFDGIYYGPEFGWDVTYMSGEVKDLQSNLKIIGMVFIVIGFFLIKRLYFRKKGIMINPPKIAILFDFISLLFIIPTAYMFANLVLSKTLYVMPITNEEFLLLMGTFLFCIGIPFITLYTSRFSSQSVLINEKGILVDSLITKDFVSWNSLDSIRFSDEYVLVSRVGIPMPKQLQKSVKITTKDGSFFVINEPQLKSVKKRITHEFEIHIPEQLKSHYLQILNRW